LLPTPKHRCGHSRLQPIIDAAKLIERHLPNVLTYFKHCITNPVAEGLNSKIATVQKRAFGYRNPDNFKNAVYFHCGGLDALIYILPLRPTEKSDEPKFRESLLSCNLGRYLLTTIDFENYRLFSKDESDLEGYLKRIYGKPNEFCMHSHGRRALRRLALHK